MWSLKHQQFPYSFARTAIHINKNSLHVAWLSRGRCRAGVMASRLITEIGICCFVGWIVAEGVTGSIRVVSLSLKLSSVTNRLSFPEQKVCTSAECRREGMKDRRQSAAVWQNSLGWDELCFGFYLTQWEHVLNLNRQHTIATRLTSMRIKKKKNLG